MPTISVIVPVYNTEVYLKRCVDSILNQSFTDFELILVNDGSTDNSGKICDEYAKIDNRTVVIHQDNQGQAVARNNALDISKGEYISFVDSDDWISNDYLKLLLYAANNNETTISMCYMEQAYEHTECIKYNDISIDIVSPDIAYVLNRKIYAYAGGRLYHKQHFNNIRFPENVYWEDLAVTYKLLFSTDRIAVINNNLYYYFQREGSTCNSPWTVRSLDYIRAIEPQINFFDKLGKDHLKRIAIECMLANIYYDQYMRLSATTNIQYKSKYIKFLRNKMRSYLVRYKHALDISIQTFPGYYELAFPVYMWFYWRIVAIFKRIRGKR